MNHVKIGAHGLTAERIAELVGDHSILAHEMFEAHIRCV
jgi:hypothetical protein